MRLLRTAATGGALALAGILALSAPASASTVGPGEGCTPGYWKNHTTSWLEEPGVTIPTTLRLDRAVRDAQGFYVGNTLFPATATTGYGGATLLDALSFKGGSGTDGAEQILLRAAAASWLNSAHEDVTYPLRRYGSGGTVARVNEALLSQDRATMLALAAELDAYNNAGCPLS